MGYSKTGTDLLEGDKNNGLLYTGDYAKRDQDGFYYIVGRKKRFIKLFGIRINLDDTENYLQGSRVYLEQDYQLLSSKDSANQKDFTNLKNGHILVSSKNTYELILFVTIHFLIKFYWGFFSF